MARTRTPPTALLIRRGETLDVLFPDDPATTEAVRKAVKAKLRYRSSRAVSYRTWSLDPDAFEPVVQTLKYHGFRVESYTQGTTAPKEGPKTTLSDRAVLGVTEAAPWPVIEAAYRTLAKMFHPDVSGGPTTERMKKINLAYERLERESKRR